MEVLVASVITALITGACSVIGVVLSSNKSTAVIQERLDRYREHTDEKIESLAKNVEKHNGLIERMVTVEQQVKTQWVRIDELKESASAGS
ncbi:hypothetical protein [uncultured Adlercreutzia sp.]|uniref:hypothetical protein n=1 Tax=uncultured Adlercreutzia sp. TaxID=875803 RepID=UPI0025F2BA49|nr:hypothetical protein [uncultured Adlercreutzia sp.]